MSEVSDVHVGSPKTLTIFVPKKLCDEFEQVVEEETLSGIMTEALAEELKKLHFRMALKKATSKAIQSDKRLP
jgi:hypothetical protein